MILRKPFLSLLISILFMLIEPSLTQFNQAYIAQPNQTNQTNQTSLVSNQTVLPEAVILEMAKRENRFHHFIWHNVRDNWNKLSPTGQQKIRELGWEPPRPARRMVNGYSVVITDNLSGEDFLYMHREMISKVNDILAVNGSSYGTNVTGWTTIPAPGDPLWPVPDPYTITGQASKTRVVNRWKTDSFYNTNIKPNEDIFMDPVQLRRMTLAELGARIDATVHGYMHLRWSGPCAYGYRPETNGIFPDIDTRWDDPEYNWLVDVYSSTLNPTFWKLHGWIDDRIEDWRKANGLTNITWNATWTGGPMSEIDFLWDLKEGAVTVGEAAAAAAASGDDDSDIMKKVARIFAKEGLETSFADPVFVTVPEKRKTKRKTKLLCKGKPKKYR